MPQPKLLLADDSITIQKVVSLTFADRGMQVISFSDGDAAVEHLDEIQPDIVLADVHMPGINGYGVCELVRSNESTRNTPVVLLVGSFEPFDQEEADRVGANTHLTKPFTSIADVVATVERLLDEVAASAGEPTLPLQPRPDTTDIDALYEQSFAETGEIPEQETIEFNIDVLDDEMIQTSYSEADPGPELDESLYVSAGDEGASVVEVDDAEADSLIAESMPTEPQPDDTRHEVEAQQTAAASDVHQHEPVFIEVTDEEGFGTMSDAEPGAASFLEAPEPEPDEEKPVQWYDPFESVAAEPPPVEAAPEPAAADFTLDDDLLEIPGSSASGSHAARSLPATNGGEIAGVSPELIELIVQKVIDRLDARSRGE